MRSASHLGTWPPCSGRSALPDLRAMDHPVPPAVSHKQLISRCLPGKGYTGPAPMTSKGRGEARSSALVSATHRIFPASIRLEIASSHDSLLEQTRFELPVPIEKPRAF